MREVKFRYRIKDNKTGKISFLFVEMVHIENPLIYGDIYWHKFEILSRDLWIGLNDKNGTEIYSGDIVKIENYGYGEIKFGKCECFINEEYGLQFWGFYIDIGKDEIIKQLASDIFDKTVIGNIYEGAEYSYTVTMPLP